MTDSSHPSGFHCTFFFFYFGVLLFRNVLEETGSKTEVDSWSGTIYLYNESVSLLEININK